MMCVQYLMRIYHTYYIINRKGVNIMTTLRIVWKDQAARPCPDFSYRKVKISRYGFGWILDLPDNNNIYASQDCAKNAIDEILGGTARRHVDKRLKKGIKIIGQKE